MWQGVEVEFCVPYKRGSLIYTYAPELIEALQSYVFPEPYSKPAVLRFSDGTPSQFLINGGRAYGDISSRPGIYDILEITTPECRNALQIVAYEKATEVYARIAAQEYSRRSGEVVHVYKTSVTRSSPDTDQYTTRGLHESYLVEREKVFEKLDLLVPYLVIRPLFCGAGGYYRGCFTISPRQFFIREVYAKEIYGWWPLICLRDEPHAPRHMYRVHVTNGEPTRSEVAIFLRQSITSYVLHAIQRGFIKEVPRLWNPAAAAMSVSENLQGDWKFLLADGSYANALDYFNAYYLEAVEKLFGESVVDDYDRRALSELKLVLSKLEQGLFEDLATRLEWAMKLKVIEKEFSQFFEEKPTPELKEAAVNQWTAVTDPTYDELAEELKVVRIVSDEEILQAVLNPPPETRAYLRVTLAERLQRHLRDLGWSHFQVDERVYAVEQLEGWTPERVEELISKVEREVEF